MNGKVGAGSSSKVVTPGGGSTGGLNLAATSFVKGSGPVKRNISWMDAPDDVYFVATDATRLVVF